MSLEDDLRRGRAISAGGRTFTDEQYLAPLRRYAEIWGKTPGLTAFDRRRHVLGANVPSTHAYLKRFGRWSKACELAGLKPHERPFAMGLRTFSDDDLLDALDRFYERHGHWPTYEAYDADRKPGDPSGGAIRGRFGGWVAARAVAIERAKRR